MQRTPLRAATLLAAISLFACSGEDSNPTGSPGAVVSLEVTPSVGTITTAGATLQLSAVARDARGREISGMPVTWSSSDQARARVDDTGMVTALSGGTVTIAARAGGVSGQAVLDIRLPPVQLTREERFAIAALLADASVEGLDFGFGQLASQAASRVDGRADMISISFEIIRDCPIDGESITTGTFVASFDRDERSGEFRLEAKKSLNHCSFLKGDVVIELHTEEPITIEASGSHHFGDDNDRPRAEAMLHVHGIVSVTRGAEDPFDCVIDLTVKWSTEEGHSASGSICGHEVGEDHDGGGGNDG